MPRATSRSGAADRTERSGQRRSWLSSSRRRRPEAVTAAAGTALLGLTLLLAGCATGESTTAGPTPGVGAASSGAVQETASEDPALNAACAAFWGDPDYSDPLSRAVLDRAATAPQAGPTDPLFYAMTGDDIDTTFQDAPASAKEPAAVLSDWFRTQPELGAEADGDAFRTAWEGLAGSCSEVSSAASWAVAPGADGTKPAALVCAEVFDTPGTLTHFGNANVLTSNMFKLVGLSAREVPAERMDEVAKTADLLTAEITAVDDDAVTAALEQVRAPFQDALEGDTWSEGLEQPLATLTAACTDAGYSSPDLGEIENGAVIGANAAHEGGMDYGERS
ncbi:hypothetical protein GCM10023160_31970 [Brachybacterium paraconglomeratum]|uniref:hypothetical protein n=1 Tax=Brachybacterium paraconglomeratum TaxID=173362 RepID=UPI0031F0D884